MTTQSDAETSVNCIDNCIDTEHTTDMTQTGTLAPRYYVARTNGNIARYATLADAKQTAAALYDLGVVAPLVVVASDRDEAAAKAARCYAGQITTKQARAL